MNSKHARLVAAVSDAKEAQGFTWKQIATMGGVSQGTISSAINSGVTMKDERWKLICEGLGLDYDEIIAPPDLSEHRSDVAMQVQKQPEAPTETIQEDQPCEPPKEGAGITTIQAESESLFLLAMYAEGRIAADIETGMKVDPMKLWAILDALRTIKKATT